MPAEDGNPAPVADNPTPPVGDGGATPPAPAADPPADNAPAEPPRTIDPVVDTPPDPNTPPATPPADDPNAAKPPEGDDGDPSDPDVADLVGEQKADPIDEQLQQYQSGDQLPSGVNEDGTIDPLIYAYSQLPPISVQGKIGVKGEIKVFQVKTAEDLPDGFKFSSTKEQVLFNSNLTQNMNLARDYVNEANEYNAGREQKNAFAERAASQTSEIAALQEAGRLPKFALKPGDAGFKDDPGAVRAQQVLDHIKEVNAEFAKKGINQEITSIEVGLMLLEAKEISGKNEQRINGIDQHRAGINNAVSNGNPATPGGGGEGTGQTVHRSLNDAIEAGLNKAGNMNG